MSHAAIEVDRTMRECTENLRTVMDRLLEICTNYNLPKPVFQGSAVSELALMLSDADALFLVSCQQEAWTTLQCLVNELPNAHAEFHLRLGNNCTVYTKDVERETKIDITFVWNMPSLVMQPPLYHIADKSTQKAVNMCRELRSLWNGTLATVYVGIACGPGQLITHFIPENGEKLLALQRIIREDSTAYTLYALLKTLMDLGWCKKVSSAVLTTCVVGAMNVTHHTDFITTNICHLLNKVLHTMTMAYGHQDRESEIYWKRLDKLADGRVAKVDFGIVLPHQAQKVPEFPRFASS